MNAFASDIQAVLVRDLKKLEVEISQYADEAALWKIEGSIANSAGTLCLHLCGNIQHYFGAVLGKTGYVRNRPNEFAARNIPKAKLLEEIQGAIRAVEKTLPHISEAQLDADYPENVFGQPMKTRYFFIHLVGHFGYHLGQINYHRRLVKGS